MRLRWLAALAAACGLSGGAAAQRPDTLRMDTTHVSELPKIVVAGERPRAAPPPVTTIRVRPELLRRTQAVNAYDLVRRTAGIEVHDQGQGPGYASDVVLRGFSSDHSSDVLLSIDGVPINLPVHGHVEGYADWSVLSPAGISAFHVISGTASPLYGDFALGGVVEVETAADAAGLGGALAGSSDGDLSGWLRGGRRGATGGFLLAGDGRRQQGWRKNASYWLGNGLARGWRRLGAFRLEGGLAGYGSDWRSPGFLSVADYNAGRLSGPADRSDGGSAYRVVAHGRATAGWGRLSLDASGWAQRVHSSAFLTIPDDGIPSQDEEQDRRWSLGGRVQLTRGLGLGDLSGGLDGRADVAGYDFYRTLARARVGPLERFDGRYAAGGAYLRYRRLVAGHLALDLGLRGDLLHYRSRDRLDSVPAWAEKTRGLVAPKLGVRWLTSGGLALLASVSRGFRGAPGVIEDPAVPPIEAWTKEVGLQLDHEKLHFHVAAFRLDVSNERIQDPVTRQISTGGSSVRQGLNGEAELRLGRLSLVGEGTVNDARVSGSSDGGAPGLLASFGTSNTPAPSFHIEPLEPGDPVPNVARYVGRTGIRAQLGRGVTGEAAVRFSGPYTPVGEPSARTRSYAVVDLGASLPLRFLHADLDLSLDNLFSAKYPEIRASGFLNPGAPRLLLMAIRFADQP